jgi:hypothetical protein
MEAEKTEFKISRQPCLSVKPSETCDHLQLLQNTPHTSQRNMSVTIEAKQELGPITMTALC